jgi:hypothetical protein
MMGVRVTTAGHFAQAVTQAYAQNASYRSICETWRTHTMQKLRSESIVVRVLRHMSHHHTHVTSSHTCHITTHIVLRHWTQRTSAAAFEAWLSCLRQIRRSEIICRRVVEHLCRRTLSRALDAWRVRTGLFPLCLCVYVSVPAAFLADGLQIRARARSHTRTVAHA